LKIAIATLATNDYLPGAHALFKSLQTFNDLTAIDLICFSNEIDSIKASTMPEVSFIPLLEMPLFETNKKVTRFAFTLYKFQIFQFIESSDYDRVIFIDSDIFCAGSIELLFQEKYSSYPLWAVRDFACGTYYSDQIENVSLNASRIINSGLLLINREFTRQLTYVDLIKILRTEGVSYDGGDQGYLNWLISRKGISIGRLDPSMNYPLDPHWPRRLTPPALIHFTGKKPWEGSPRRLSKDYFIYKVAIRYLRIIDKSPETTTHLNKISLKPGILKIELILAWIYRFLPIHFLFPTFKLALDIFARRYSLFKNRRK
jgi:lipopolysaccharide biosynthesis glycosyltransferase